jgi:putative RNA 2'-phosphotransferase
VTKPSKTSKTLSKLLTYVLGSRPDEFGLVADSDGFVSIKELLKSLCEEEGWRHLRRAHLNEVAATIVPCPIEIEEDRIRVKQRDRLPQKRIPQELPRLLYLPVRSRAYPRVSARGIIAGSRPHLVCSSQRKMAERLGRRIDNKPIILTIQVSKLLDKGIDIKQYGETLHLVDEIPVNAFSGPPLPKEKAGTAKPTKTPPPPRDPSPGSYYPDFLKESTESHQGRRNKGKGQKKDAQWKKARRAERKHKHRQQGR